MISNSRHIDFYEEGAFEDDYNLYVKYDFDELSTPKIDLDNPIAIFKLISKSVENTACNSNWISILRHLLLIKNKSDGDRYWNTIDLLIQQIILQIDGKNVDVEKEILKLDMREIVQV